MDLSSQEITERLAERIRAVLIREQAPVKRWRLQQMVSARGYGGAEGFQGALDWLATRSAVTISPDGMVGVIDKGPIRQFPSLRRRGRSHTPSFQLPEPEVGRGALAIRAAVWDRTGGTCWYCGRQTNPFRDFQIDHVVPINTDAPVDLDNLVPACAPCAFAKRNKSIDDFRQLYPSGHRFYFESE